MKHCLSLLILAGVVLPAQVRTDAEAKLGASLDEDVRRCATAWKNEAAEAYLRGLAQRLAPERAADVTFEIALDTLGENTNQTHEPLSLPGGSIFVPASLFAAAESEAEFAGMIAHAMAHAAREYPLRSGNAFWINMRGWCAREILPLGLLERSREEELRADRQAAGMLMRAGFDPGALARYLERTQASENESKATWLPARAERLAAIEDAAGPLLHAGAASSEEFLAVQRQVREWQPAREAPSLRRARR